MLSLFSHYCSFSMLKIPDKEKAVLNPGKCVKAKALQSSLHLLSLSPSFLRKGVVQESHL